MVVQAPEIERAEQEVLKAVGSGLSNPAVLIEKLATRGFDEELIRAAIWFLIDRGWLDLTRDWQLAVSNTR
jgi:DNA-binding transcriptional regulator PaaX